MTGNQPKGWHGEAVSDSTKSALRALLGTKLLNRFYLAGGTALALHLGHRLSQDLDFFATDLFHEEPLLQELQQIKGFSLVAKQPHTLHVTIDVTKVSFLGYAYPVLFPYAYFLEVAVADQRDIACMKVSAIASRGTKRDFVDLYIAARQFGLPNILGLFDRKYSKAGYNKLHILKSLVFFDDAEKDPMPHMLVSLDWQDVKHYLMQETSKLL